MVPDKQISEFVGRLRRAAEDNLESVILYGSAVSGGFNPEFSDVNLLCVLRDASYRSLSALSPAVEWWNRQKHPAPLIMTRHELEHSADVFSIELLDILQHHRVLFGKDVLQDLQVPMTLHRVQVEYELREKLILLREHLLVANGNSRRLWDLLLRSLPAFTTLFRHALLTLGATAPATKREAVAALATRVQFDASAFLQLLDIREHKSNRKQLDVADVASRYLEAVRQVTEAVDTMLQSPGGD